MHVQSTAADRAAKARETHMLRAAERAIDDPSRLARAARIVRVALARRRLALTDVLPPEDRVEASAA